MTFITQGMTLSYLGTPPDSLAKQTTAEVLVHHHSRLPVKPCSPCRSLGRQIRHSRDQRRTKARDDPGSARKANDVARFTRK